MNKKHLFGSLVSVVLVIGGSYFLAGKLIQQSYYDTIVKINSQPGVRVSLANYERGLFSSTAKLTVNLNGTDIPMEQSIKHGPFLITESPKTSGLKFAASELVTKLDDNWQTKLKTYTGSEHPLTIVTLVDYQNNANTWIKFTNIDQNTPEQLHVAWDAISGHIVHDLSFSAYNGSVEIPKLALSTPDWNFEIQNSKLNLDSQQQDSNYTLKSVFHVKNLAFSKLQTEQIKLDDITTEVTLSRDPNGVLGFNLATNLANSQIVQQKFAQDNVKLQINNINFAALQNLAALKPLNPQNILSFVQQLTANTSQLSLEVPKHFSESLLSYISFELYKHSLVGKMDRRPENEILLDISNSINNLVQGALHQKLFVDQGAYYTFSMNTPAPTAAPTVLEAATSPEGTSVPPMENVANQATVENKK